MYVSGEEEMLVIDVARPAIVPDSKLPVNKNRHTGDVPDTVYVALYTNFFIPGIVFDTLVHCVRLISAGHTGVISTPAFGGSIARSIVVT